MSAPLSTSSLLHVHGGALLLARLAAARVPGERLEWSDPVSTGPTPGGLSEDAWYATRAAHLARSLGAPDATACEARLRAQDAALDAVPAETEIALWAGPELVCQAIAMRLLARLGDRRRLSLVQPGDRPGVPGCGLEALTDAELHDALARRRPATGADVALARRAWAAFTASSAEPLVELVRTGAATAGLPFLGAALARHLEDLPDGATGLSTTETRLLERLRSGPASPPELLRALAARETRPFATDALVHELLERLASGDAPLVGIDPHGAASITKRGEAVLESADVWFAPRWHGGIEITRDEDDEAGGGVVVLRDRGPAGPPPCCDN